MIKVNDTVRITGTKTTAKVTNILTPAPGYLTQYYMSDGKHQYICFRYEIRKINK